MTIGVKKFTAQDLQQLSTLARETARNRINRNIHEQLDDGIQRLFNALEPDTYVQPHCHDADRWEYFQILQGAGMILLFSQTGQLMQRFLLSTDQTLAVEIPGACIHTIVSLQSGTVLFELKPGPYTANTDKNFAPWAPQEGQDQCPLFLNWFKTAQIGNFPPKL